MRSFPISQEFVNILSLFFLSFTFRMRQEKFHVIVNDFYAAGMTVREQDFFFFKNFLFILKSFFSPRATSCTPARGT